MTSNMDYERPPESASFVLGWTFAEQPALQLVYETAPIGLAFLSTDCRYLRINQRLTDICGVSVEEHLGRPVRDCAPALAPAIEEIVRSIVATGEPVLNVEVSGQSDQSEQRSWITHWHPLRNHLGDILGINVVAEEITERKRALAALEAREQQFHTLADALPQLVWMAHTDGTVFWFNVRWYEYTGFESENPIQCDWKGFLAPDSLTSATTLWHQSLRAGTALEVELPLRGKDGQYRPFLTRIIPLRDRDLNISMWIGTHIDISEQKLREEHTRIVNDELSHRTKNLLTVVLAISNQTAQYAESVEQYQRSFSDRLHALAHCHELLLRNNWQGSSFRDLVAAQMKPFGGIEAGRIKVTGQPIILQPEAVQHVGLALHELATNATKHGALSGTSGRVSIHWAHDRSTGRIVLCWQESGGPSVTPPNRSGFGRVVIEKIVPSALNGCGTLAFSASGLSWTFEFPARSDKINPSWRDHI